MYFFFFQAEDGIRDLTVTGVQTCALPIWEKHDMKYAFALGAINPATLAGNEMYAGLFDVTTDNKTLDVAVDGKFDAFGRRHSLSFGANTGRMVNDSDYSLIRMGLPNNVFEIGRAHV